MRDNPALLGIPLAVGGSPSRRGVIATCNYEARKFGIHSAMASQTARVRCPDLIIIKPDMQKYREASAQIHEIFKRFTDIIEPLSLDEAYLDVTECSAHQGSATLIAEAIRQQVKDEVRITISAGVAPNKFLAKVASDWNKPDGVFVVEPQDILEFVSQLPVKKLHGVGKVTALKMKSLGILTCKDLQTVELNTLKKHFGSFGERLANLSQGVDDRQVKTSRTRKSVSVENTYAKDLHALEQCLDELPELESRLEQRLSDIRSQYKIHKQFIKVKFHDFEQTTVEMLSPTLSSDNFRSLCTEGFQRGDKPVRLLGVGLRLQPLTESLANTRAEDQLMLTLETDG
jgi:DNA polymerase-4